MLNKKIDVHPQRGQILITSPIDNLKLTGCYHSHQGYYYFRPVGKRLLIGGARQTDFENENTSTIATTKTIQNNILKYIKAHLNIGSFKVEQQWAGIMGFTNNKKPIVTSTQKNIYTAIGLSGMGVALAPVLADELVTIIK
jgi:gamma-glutamylputrescine oxidase